MTTKAEHGRGDEGLGLLETGGHAGKKADLGIDGLDQAYERQVSGATSIARR